MCIIRAGTENDINEHDLYDVSIYLVSLNESLKPKHKAFVRTQGDKYECAENTNNNKYFIRNFIYRKNC